MKLENLALPRVHVLRRQCPGQIRRFSRLLARVVCGLIASVVCACSSIGPRTVARDRIDYVTAIGESWKQQTLLNIVKLRYGDFPTFLEVTQVIAGYQFQSTVGGGFNAGNSSSSTVGPFSVGGTALVQGQYTDRPTLTYAPLTGPDFLKKLMTPIPPSALLFMLQSGYAADRIMPITIESINGIGNEAQRGRLNRPANPQFSRLIKLIRDQQLAGAFEVRIEHLKGRSETSMILFGPSKDPEVLARTREIKSILGLRPDLTKIEVHYGGYSGKDNEIDMTTRSMLQIMLELAAVVRVPASDVADAKAFPGLVSGQVGGTPTPPMLNIMSGEAAPGDAFVEVAYEGHWFWIANNDVQSKFTFGFLQLLFTISDTGVRGTPVVVTVPANE